MKKGIPCFMLTVLLLLSSLQVAWAAASIQVDGRTIASDVPPQIVEGRLLAPIAVISQALDCHVDWNPKDKSVTIVGDGVVIALTLGSKRVLLNSTEMFLDVPAQAIQGRTMIPFIFIAEALGCQFSWDQNSRTAFITRPSPAAGVQTPEPAPTPVRTPSVTRYYSDTPYVSYTVYSSDERYYPYDRYYYDDGDRYYHYDSRYSSYDGYSYNWYYPYNGYYTSDGYYVDNGYYPYDGYYYNGYYPYNGYHYNGYYPSAPYYNGYYYDR